MGGGKFVGRDTRPEVKISPPAPYYILQINSKETIMARKINVPMMIVGVSIPLNKICRDVLTVSEMGTGFSQSLFYRPGKDVLLSPVESRCVNWSSFPKDINTDKLLKALIR